MKDKANRDRSTNYKGLFVTDLDGTLLTNNRNFTPKDLEALGRLRQDGYLVAIATGRSNYSFNKLIDSLGFSGAENSLPVDYIIFSTGAGIMDLPGKRLLKSFSLTLQDTFRITTYLETTDLDYMIHRPVPETRYFLYNYRSGNNPDFYTRLKMYGDFGTPVSSLAIKRISGATEVLCIVQEDKGHQIAAQLSDVFKEFSVIKATSPLDKKSIWIEIFAPEVSKSQSVKWLAESLEIQRKDICAIGNDYNDEDLLYWADKSFVVSNSPSSLKSVFKTVSSNECGGVSEAVDCWLTLMEKRF